MGPRWPCLLGLCWAASSGTAQEQLEPLAPEVSSLKHWLALLDTPVAGQPDPQTGFIRRSSSASVVGCFDAATDWLEEPFIRAAESESERFQFLRTRRRKLCNAAGLAPGQIAVVTSAFQSSEDGQRDAILLDLAEEARRAELKTLPPRMALTRVKNLVEEAGPPAVGVMTSDNMLHDYNSARPLVVLFCAFDSIADDFEPGKISRVPRQQAFARSEQARWCRQPLLGAAATLKAEGAAGVTFAVAEAEEHRAMELLEFGFGRLESVGVGARTKSGYKYRLEADDELPTVEALVQFARAVLDAEGEETGVVGEVLRPYRKSAPRPRAGKKGAVKEVVGDTFDTVVLDEEKDALVAFYAPWSDESATLNKELSLVAKALRQAKAKRVTLAKVDLTTNDAPRNFAVQRFPTVYWAGRGAKAAPEQYTGELTAAAISAFLCERRGATDPFPVAFGCADEDEGGEL